MSLNTSLYHCILELHVFLTIIHFVVIPLSIFNKVCKNILMYLSQINKFLSKFRDSETQWRNQSPSVDLIQSARYLIWDLIVPLNYFGRKLVQKWQTCIRPAVPFFTLQLLSDKKNLITVHRHNNDRNIQSRRCS